MCRGKLATLFIAALWTTGCQETVENDYRDHRALVASGAMPTLVRLVPDSATDIQFCTDPDSGGVWGTYLLRDRGDLDRLAVSPIPVSSLVGRYTGSPGHLDWWPSWWRRSVSVEALTSSGLAFFETSAGDPGSVTVIALDKTSARVYLWIRRKD